jgi:hypothetical protein
MFIKFNSTTYKTLVNTGAPMMSRCILTFDNKMSQYFSRFLNVTLTDRQGHTAEYFCSQD